MKVSVIICTRNRRKLLMERALPSVLKQTYKDFEVIIIDDASEDDTLKKVLALEDKRITIVRNEKRRGLAYGRNLGAKLAKGEYVVSLDDDNMFHPTFLQKTAWYLDMNDVGAVGVGKNIVYPEREVYQKPPRVSVYCSINDGWLIRKDAFNAIKCDETLNANEDADLGIRFCKVYNIGRIDEPLMTVYGSAAINKTSYSDYSEFHLDGMDVFIEKHLDTLLEHPKELAHVFRQAGRMNYLGGKREKALDYFWRAEFAQPSLRNWLHLTLAKLGIYKPFFILETKIIRYFK